MGGLGSGERFSKKGTVEGRYSLDTSDLKRWNMLTPGAGERAGSFSWGHGEQKNVASISYRITVGPTSGALRLLYALSAQKTECDYTVRLVTTPCRLGGVRWWFRCPLTKNGIACGRRVRKLYLCGRYFGCRHCHDLVYRSQQESDSRVYAMARAGLDAMPPIEGASLTQMGVMLRALTIMQKRLNRPLF